MATVRDDIHIHRIFVLKSAQEETGELLRGGYLVQKSAIHHNLGELQMKKTLAATITTALVIGVASTTFAATNPFSDVPTDHWSFDAVAKLAKEGVIEGYGDNTFRGDAHITRYEMAQMVAKAMAKENLSGADRVTVDRLTAEYAQELNNLGVRIAALEGKTDNVKFDGVVRYRAQNLTDEASKTSDVKNNYSKMMGRLNMDAQVNDDWHAKTRIEWTQDLDNGTNADGTGKMDRAYAEGPLFGGTAMLGKYPVLSYDVGFMLDHRVNGAGFEWSGEKLTTRIDIGRMNGTHLANAMKNTDGWGGANRSYDYQGIQFKYKASAATALNLQYHHVSDSDFKDLVGDDQINMISVGFQSMLGGDFKLNGQYTHSDADKYTNHYRAYNAGAQRLSFNEDDPETDAYLLQLTYKGGQLAVPHSYGIWAAYKQMPAIATLSETYVDEYANQKGWEFGIEYVPAKNIMTKMYYLDGKDVNDSDAKRKIFRGQVEFYY